MPRPSASSFSARFRYVCARNCPLVSYNALAWQNRATIHRETKSCDEWRVASIIPHERTPMTRHRRPVDASRNNYKCNRISRLICLPHRFWVRITSQVGQCNHVSSESGESTNGITSSSMTFLRFSYDVPRLAYELNKRPFVMGSLYCM